LVKKLGDFAFAVLGMLRYQSGQFLVLGLNRRRDPALVCAHAI